MRLDENTVQPEFILSCDVLVRKSSSVMATSLLLAADRHLAFTDVHLARLADLSGHARQLYKLQRQIVKR